MLTPEDFRRRVIRRFHRLGRLDNYDDLQVLELLLLFALPPESAQAAATELLEYYGSVASILEAPTVELQTFPHMTIEAMALIHLVPELGRYHMVQRACLARPLNTTTDCGNYLLPHFHGEQDEVVYLLCLDANYQPRDCRMLFRGSVNTAGVSVRSIVRVALACNATWVVLAHNHTSDVPMPSVEDERTTQRIGKALDAVGIGLADHIIVAGGSFVSMMDLGLLRDHGAGAYEPSAT